ncbi:MAG: zinc metalloprotease HtpX [Salaquimonas sp.]
MNELSINYFNQKRHSFLNMLHTWVLVGGSLLLLVFCAWVFFGSTGILYAAVFGGISLFMASRISPEMVLRMYKAQPVSREQFPVGHQILDQLVERAGLEHRPILSIIPSNMMNAFAVGRKHNSAIAMTDKLVSAMTQRELAGVMAHEMAHIRNEDVKVMAIADMVSRFTSMMSTFGTFALLANLPSLFFGTGAAVPWILVVILMAAPTIGGLLQLALSRTREYDADLGAILLTGDPDGLASALVKLEKVQRRNWEGMVLPGGRSPHPSLLRSHPKTEDRVERLMALKATPEQIGEIASGRVERDDIIPQEFRREVPKRSSPVPKIQRKWGRGEGSKYAEYASLLNASSIDPVHDKACEDDAACNESLNAAKDNPKIRFTRGGVWW